MDFPLGNNRSVITFPLFIPEEFLPMRWFLPLLFSLFVSLTSYAQTDTLGTLRVGLAEMPPYCILDDQGVWTGMGVELWRRTAEEKSLRYEYVRYETPELLTRAVAGGEVDVAINPELELDKEQGLDYLQTYHLTTLGVATRDERGLLGTVKAVFTKKFLQIVLALSALLLVVGFLIWLVERKENEEQFGGGGSKLRGIGAGFWWAGVTMTTIGYGDKAPQTPGGRALAMLWMLLALAVTSSLTAAIISAAGGSDQLSFPGDLKDKAVGAVTESSTAETLRRNGVGAQPYPSTEAGLRALANKDIDAFADDAATLRYVIDRSSGLEANVQTTRANPHVWAFAVARGSDLATYLDRTVLRLVSAESWQQTKGAYLPSGE